MDRSRRPLLALLALSLLPLAGAQAQPATDFPKQPIRLLVPYAAGGSPDVLARRLADALKPLLGVLDRAALADAIANRSAAELEQACDRDTSVVSPGLGFRVR